VNEDPSRIEMADLASHATVSQKVVISAVLGVLFFFAGRPAVARAEIAVDSSAPQVAGGVAPQSDWKLRVPLTPPASIQPYAAINGERANADSNALARRLASGDPDASRMAMGTGVRWKIPGGVELFGEYDFLSAAAPANSKPELEARPELRGGFSIPF